LLLIGSLYPPHNTILDAAKTLFKLSS